MLTGKYTNHKGRNRRFTNPEELEEQRRREEKERRWRVSMSNYNKNVFCTMTVVLKVISGCSLYSYTRTVQKIKNVKIYQVFIDQGSKNTCQYEQNDVIIILQMCFSSIFFILFLLITQIDFFSFLILMSIYTQLTQIVTFIFVVVIIVLHFRMLLCSEKSITVGAPLWYSSQIKFPSSQLFNSWVSPHQINTVYNLTSSELLEIEDTHCSP